MTTLKFKSSTTPTTDKEVTCPDCSGPMKIRENKTNGTKFWGCKSFPDCRGTRDSNGMSKEDKANLDPQDDGDYRYDRNN